MARLSKLFSFTNWATNRPKDPVPGDHLDDEFAAVRKAVNDIDGELKDVRRADGKLNNGLVTKDSLSPTLLAELQADITKQVGPILQNATGDIATMRVMEASAKSSAMSADQAAKVAKSSAGRIQDDLKSTLKLTTALESNARRIDVEVKAAQVTLTNSTQAAIAAERKAGLYATLSSYWAEWMGNANSPGDQTLPPNILKEMGISGDHWSARWWANKAAGAFGQLTALYLGVHPDHASALAAALPNVPAVGSIYYNNTSNQPYIWTGHGFQPFWAPQKAITTTLYYKTTAAQAEFPLGTADLFANSFTLDRVDVEPIDIYVNGVRLFPTTGTPPKGDYTVDATNNKVVLSQAINAGSVVAIDILTPRDKFAVGTVNFHALVDLDLDPVTLAPGRQDGVRTDFTLARADGKPLAIGGADELFVSVNGVIQQPGVTYNVVGSRITFTTPPEKDAKVWARWMEPGGAGGSGKGVNPPPAPEDLHSNRLGWMVGTGVVWDDNRGEMHSVANAAARLALRDPEQLIPGAMVYERDTHDIWCYTPKVTPVGGTTVRSDITATPGDPNFRANILKLKNGDTVFYKGQYYQVTGVPSLGEENFPGGTAYAINPAPFVSQFSPVAGPSWNNYQAPTTPGMAAPVAAPSTSGDPKLASNWTMALKGHPTDNILRSLEYDPSKPDSMAWEDNRDAMETVNAVADLNNRTILPASHLTVGKLVYVRATGELWECMVDGTNGTITNSATDWKQLGGGLKYVNRAGNLPASGVPNGALYIVLNEANGNPAYNRLVAWSATNNAWVYPTTRNFMHPNTAAPQDVGDVDGDLQITYENGHALLEAWDAFNTTWQTIYSEDTVKQWIAASNLFQGTVEDRGHGTVGAIDLNVMKAQSALGVTDAGHYWIYVGLAGHVVAANEIGGAASNIDGAKLNVGDWLLVANTGTAAAPVMKYTHIPGDLLAKSRGDGLYGLNAYAPGAYEIGSLVVSGGDIYKASRAVLLADPAPGATGAPWVKVDISGGVKTVAADSNLPTAAPNGAVYLVLSSAQAGGKGALYMRDNPSSKWQALGGGGTPLSLSGGKKIVDVGVPVGTVIDFAGKTLPAGYLLCDGATFSSATYPRLAAVLGGNVLPDLRNQFVRGASSMAAVSFTKHDATTGMPKTHFTGVSNSSGSHTHTTDNPGDHRHNVGFSMSDHNWKGGGGWSGDATCNFSQDGGAASSAAGGHTHTTTSAGAHTHTVEINSGGDAETAPAHVILAKIIKADEIGALAI